MERWARFNFQPNLPLGENGKRLTASDEHIRLSYEAAAEGMVLLKNEEGVLPLKKDVRVALFGKATFDYVQGGGGSGEVYPPYVHNIYDGFKQRDVSVYEPLADYYRENVEHQFAEGAVPGMTVEPSVPDQLLEEAAAYTDTAVISICRFSGEGWDRMGVKVSDADSALWDNISAPARIASEIFERGDYYLTNAEEKMISEVTRRFSNVVVVLNVGGIIDTQWIRENPAIRGALLAWAPGMEGGCVAADILLGCVNPSGRLSDTFAKEIEDYPSTATFIESQDHVNYEEDIFVGYRYFETLPGAASLVNYPFGFGLSYTDFEVEPAAFEASPDGICLKVRVRNTGKMAGKETAAVYCEPPRGKLDKPHRVLAGFAKTDLLQPLEEQELTVRVSYESIASYDDAGKVQKSARLLEKGSYRFYIGGDVRSASIPAGSFDCAETRVLDQLSARILPGKPMRRMTENGGFEDVPYDAHKAYPNNKLVPLTEKEMECLTPQVHAQNSRLFVNPYPEGAITLQEVADGRHTVEELMDQMTREELAIMVGGQPNTGVGITFGVGNCPDHGIPDVITADGPAGVRIQPRTGVRTTAWPCATLLACTWNEALVEQVGKAGGAELKENNMGIWLTPAINIHRSPLCGRNFEYYSEDPLLTGKLAASMVRGIQSNGVGACAKHFAFNNKETNRKYSDSRVSERAAREIYLRAFEIVVREADPRMIMSSYNIVNGIRCAECRELLEDILRGEWGYQGVVTTDWWAYSEEYLELAAGNDLKMGLGFPDRVLYALDHGLLSEDLVRKSAQRIVEMILKLD